MNVVDISWRGRTANSGPPPFKGQEVSYLLLEQKESAVGKALSETDEEVLRLSIATDPELFSVIVRRYQEAFLRKARSILKDEAEAEDVVQEVFVKIYAKGARFHRVAGASFKSWAYKILINTCLTVYRKTSRTRINVSPEEFDETLLAVAGNDASESRLSYDAFLSILSRMPQTLALLLRRMVLFGQHPKEIALSEGISTGAVRTRLHRARRAFEKVRIEIN